MFLSRATDRTGVTEITREELRERAERFLDELKTDYAFPNDCWQAGLISVILTEEAFRHLYGDIREKGSN